MKTCKSCLTLNGRPSSTGPHPSLVNKAAEHYCSGSDKQKIGQIWLCVECGSTMRQSSRHDREFPNSWNFSADG